jgi:hypothetical protein
MATLGQTDYIDARTIKGRDSSDNTKMTDVVVNPTNDGTLVEIVGIATGIAVGLPAIGTWTNGNYNCAPTAATAVGPSSASLFMDLQNESSATIRVAVGATASTTVGQRLLPGQTKSIYVGGGISGVSVYVIGSATAAVSVMYGR